MTRLWTDAPIRSRAEDDFGRTAYTAHAARLIVQGHTWEDSVTYALTGAWGSGKTSMLAMIVEDLRELDPSWGIARITPWATGDVTGLLGDFFATLASALPKDHARQARHALGALSELSAPAAATALPYGGTIVSGAMRRGGAALRRRRPWDVAFEEAAVAIRTVDTPVLLVADDIDRLQPDELLALLKVVRLLGRFGGVHYLLAYDEATLFANLAASGVVNGDAESAQRFMEKIVQYPLVVPALSTRQLSARVESGITDILVGTGRSVTAFSRLGDLDGVFRALLPTPRAVDRFLAQLRHHVPLLEAGEVNEEDVIVLTLLRVAFPLLYDKLPRVADGLTSGHTGESAEPLEEMRMASFDIGPLVGVVPTSSRPLAARLLRDLFPALPTPGPDFAKPIRPLAISNEAYFERYFTMSIPPHDVSDLMVARLVDGAAQGDVDALLEELTAHPDERALTVMEKAAGYTASLGVNDELRSAVLSLLLPHLQELSDDGGFLTSPRQRATRWVVELLLGLSDSTTSDSVAAVLDTASSIQTRAVVVLRVARHPGLKPAFLRAVVEHVAGDVADLLLDHVTQRDQAEGEPGWQVTYLADLGQGLMTRDRFATGIREGQFTLEDVAARFISTDYDLDDVLKLKSYRRDEFNALAPLEDDEWYRLQSADVAAEDLRWANRRTAARGGFARPVEPTPPRTS